MLPAGHPLQLEPCKQLFPASANIWCRLKGSPASWALSALLSCPMLGLCFSRGGTVPSQSALQMACIWTGFSHSTSASVACAGGPVALHAVRTG